VKRELLDNIGVIGTVPEPATYVLMVAGVGLLDASVSRQKAEQP
jgi:hypothetical protein